jgi:hypothetical protein
VAYRKRKVTKDYAALIYEFSSSYFKLEDDLSRIHVTHSLSLKIIRILVFSVTPNMNPILNPVLPVNPCIST